MRPIQFLARSAPIALAVLLFALQPASAKEGGRQGAAPAAAQDESIAAPADISAPWPSWRPVVAVNKPKPLQRSEAARATAAVDHRLILQVNSNDAAAMNLALNNATNVIDYYKSKGEKVKIEVVTFGPGLHMLRSDTSPVKNRIEAMAIGTPEVTFKACGNTREKMRKAEDKEIPILSEARIVDSGVVRVMELQENGWSYVKP
ncbi:MAG: hypothetical protein JWR89_756 [Tardiphaga sp.]|jgi:intracellular sulfur oxidation DsrE/DsrF family protein|nr:hypothetical protein [Tardiphaga sp.]